MKPAIEQAATIARQRLADAHAHAMAFDGAKAKNRLNDITSIVKPHTGVLWSGWADLYRILWRERRLEIGDRHGVEWGSVGDADIAKAIAGVKVATTTPMVLLELHASKADRLMGAAIRTGDPNTLKAWLNRSSDDIPRQISHIAITVAYRLNAIAARQVVRPEFLSVDPTFT